ncbi:type VII toxin-antitoxin system MntA family adenylyltransferase antitoxin [Trichloromonas sp.]|uniref:type VII toxin-antitoxin system MntA family adenylyltransferase antitoxin n=1 Tax=Trichloromonas sp. TaxID=3069249 RepID=UPI002A471F33|nr:nucleotidyltransferase domain-containing protein [Trichloromonas sp.]
MKGRLPSDIFFRVEKLGSAFEGDDRIVFAYLFGSLAKGAPKPLADVDIAAYLASGSTGAEVRAELSGLVADVLGTDAFDLVVLNSAPLSLVGRILGARRIIADKQPYLRHAFESRMLREFFDFSRREQEILFRRFAY